MSKEQTPITAEEFLNINADFDMRFCYGKDVEDLMEQYAQAKVLEALEREVPKAFNEDPHNRDYPAYMGYKSGIERVKKK
jgi:hypothetical protein